MSAEIKIKKLNKTHEAAVIEILDQSNNYHYSQNPDYFAQSNKGAQTGYTRWILNDRKNFGFVAVDGKKIVGLLFAGKMKKPSVMRVTNIYYLYDIAIDRNYKRRGIGRKLMDALEQKAQKNKVRQIELNVYDFNCSALAFYEDIGFHTISHTMIQDL